MAERTPRRTVGDDAIDERQRLVIQRHHALGIQLAERDLEPCALARHFVYAIELQVHQLTDAQSRCAHEQQRISAQPVGPALKLTNQAAIGIRWDIAR